MSGFKERLIAAQERLARPDRLGALAARGGLIFCWCNRCAHHARIDGRQLSLTLGPDFPVPEIGAKLRCSSCGAKDVATSAEIASGAVNAAPPLAAPPAAARPIAARQIAPPRLAARPMAGAA